jgi:toxin-antitoxin system PIN domain toxin
VILPDVNLLVYAHRLESVDHEDFAAWLCRLASGPEPFALSDSVCAGFVRVVTNPRIWRPPSEPTPLALAFDFLTALRGRPNARLLSATGATWRLFESLCRESGARGKLTADAWHAAIAIENGCEFATVDADFGRFRQLRSFHPLAPA